VSAGSSAPSTGAGAAALFGVPAAADRVLSQRVSVGFRLDGATAFGSARAPVFGTGSFDFSSERGREVIDLPELPHQEPGTEHLILLPARAYLQPRGTSTVALPRGKSWMSVTLAGSESIATNFPSFIGQLEGVNPLLLLQELAWGATAAVPVAEGPALAGVHAQGYRVAVDLPRALAAAGRAGAAVSSLAIQQQLAALGGGGSSAARVSVFAWVDRDGRIVQLRATPPGAGVGTASIALEQFGVPVRVTEPDAAGVVALTALTPSGERESNGGGDSDGA
jgi:hypothetical protein